MYGKLPSYSANFLGGRIDRVRVFWVGGGGASGAASTRLAAPTTRRRFIGFFAELREALRLLVLALLRDLSAVAASRCCFLRALSAASSAARAFLSSRRTSAAYCRATFAASCCCFLYKLSAALRSLSRAFWSCCCSASSLFMASRARASRIFLGDHKTAPP